MLNFVAQHGKDFIIGFSNKNFSQVIAVTAEDIDVEAIWALGKVVEQIRTEFHRINSG